MRIVELLKEQRELPLVIQIIHDLIDKGEVVAFYRGRTERDRRIYRMQKENIKPFERGGKTGWRLDSPMLPFGTFTFIPDSLIDSYQLEQHPTKEIQGKKVWMLLKPDQTIRKKVSESLDDPPLLFDILENALKTEKVVAYIPNGSPMKTNLHLSQQNTQSLVKVNLISVAGKGALGWSFHANQDVGIFTHTVVIPYEDADARYGLEREDGVLVLRDLYLKPAL